MKVSIILIGSRGDIQPSVPFGVGLKKAGYDVTLVTHQAFETLICDAGLNFSAMRTDIREIVKSDAGKRAMSGINPIRKMQTFTEILKPHLKAIMMDCWNACQDTDVILYNGLFAGLIGSMIAKDLNIPHIAANVMPSSPTGAFPRYTLTTRNLGQILNRATYPIASLLPRFFLWPAYYNIANEWRQEDASLPPLSPNYWQQWKTDNHPIMYTFSPHVIPKPSDWGDHIEITGYWFMDAPSDWEPPAELVNFIESGPRPIYVGFSSMSSKDPEKITSIVLQSLERTKQRAVLCSGWGGLHSTDVPDSIFFCDFVPHDWLFPRMAAVIHQGGCGSTGSGLRAGVPSIVVPFIEDQPFWGHRVAKLGAGPRPIPIKEFSVERLSAAIIEATTDKEMQRRAAMIGEKIQSEDGVANAVTFMNRYLSK